MSTLELMSPRFRSHVQVLDNDCWFWTAAKHVHGYGSYSIGGRLHRAHRVAYSVAVGEIPPGLVLDHFLFPDEGCIGPACCNPDHVRPVTQRENLLRSNSMSARHRAKTACPQGHPYDEANTYLDHKGTRHCRRCVIDRRRARSAKSMNEQQGRWK